MGLNSFLVKCKRVWMALKKPNKKEFLTTAKVAGMGIAILGVFGFAVSIIMKAFV
jgi:protein translocase SEC61 complex gamma subunit